MGEPIHADVGFVHENLVDRRFTEHVARPRGKHTWQRGGAAQRHVALAPILSAALPLRSKARHQAGMRAASPRAHAARCGAARTFAASSLSSRNACAPLRCSRSDLRWKPGTAERHRVGRRRRELHSAGAAMRPVACRTLPVAWCLLHIDCCMLPVKCCKLRALHARSSRVVCDRPASRRTTPGPAQASSPRGRTCPPHTFAA